MNENVYSHNRDLAEITRALENAFPDAGMITPLYLLGEGFSSLALETASGVVFRIARSAEAGQRYFTEYTVLPLLQPFLPLAIPNPRWFLAHSDVFPFGIIGYPKLAGKPLDLDSARSIAPYLAPQLSTILRAFHQIPPESIPLEDALSARRIRWREQRERVLPSLREALHADEYQLVTTWFEAFLKDEQMRNYQPVVQHGDFWVGNFLMEGERIAGLLDFENVSIGDPALDFVPLLYLGEAFFRSVLAEYELEAGAVDAGFMHRLRQLWALREFSGLEWSIENGDHAEFKESIEKTRKGPILSPAGLNGWYPYSDSP